MRKTPGNMVQVKIFVPFSISYESRLGVRLKIFLLLSKTHIFSAYSACSYKAEQVIATNDASREISGKLAGK
ncbi:MAG: hypothetical protein WCR20_08430 [Verrucomicrobiota bacterium]